MARFCRPSYNTSIKTIEWKTRRFLIRRLFFNHNQLLIMEARTNFDNGNYRFAAGQEDIENERKTSNAAHDVTRKGKRPRIRKPLFSVTFGH